MTLAVSVLMPVYNGERWLSQAIESALAQTFTNFELVVVDDGSTDGSVAIVESLALRDRRVRLVSVRHAGVSTARSISLSEACGRFVAFLDADDEWLPVRLERQLPHADDGTVVFSDAYIADGDRRTDERWSDWDLVPDRRYPATGVFPDLIARGSFLPMLTVLAARQLLLDAGAFRGFADGCEDLEMWLRLALRGVRFHYIDEPLAIYRRHAGSLSADEVRTWERHLLVADRLMLSAQGRERGLVRGWTRRTRRVLEVAYRKRAWRQIVAGEGGAARRDLLRSLRVRPYSPRVWMALSLSLCPPLARWVVRGRA